MSSSVGGQRISSRRDLWRGPWCSVWRGIWEPDGIPVWVRVARQGATPRELRALARDSLVAASVGPALAPAPLGELLVDGETLVLYSDTGEVFLRDLLGAGGMPDRPGFLIRLAEQLVLLHDKGVVHGNLCPESVLVDPSGGRPRLTDFRFSLCLSDPSADTSVYLWGLRERLAYAAPEQLRRGVREVGPRTDLYSLGVLAFELMTGRLPFVPEEEDRWRFLHLAALPPAAIQVEPSVPPGVSETIARLLAKDPSARFASASDVLTALRESQRAVSAPRALHAPSEFHISSRLYGRASLLDELRNSFERAARGGPQVVSVAGVAGAGKTTLLRTFEQEIGAVPTVLWSKFDQSAPNLPSSAWAKFIASWVEGVVCEPDARLERWGQLLRSTLGSDLSLLLEWVPSLSALFGDEIVPPVAASETGARFGSAVSSFFACVAAEASRLVLVIDDLQWADPASVELLDALLERAAEESLPLLVMACYRSEELSAEASFGRVLDDLRTREAISLRELQVDPLDEEAVGALVHDSFGAPVENADELVQYLLVQTGGNPLFLRRLLTSLHREARITFSSERRRWSWAGRDGSPAGDESLLGLIEATIARLPPESATLVRELACLGASCTQIDLARVFGRGAKETRDLLEPVVDAHLMRPTSDGWTFAHDRVQQAATSSLSPSQRGRIHGLIGEKLLTGADRAERLLEAVDHLNLAGRSRPDHLSPEEYSRLNIEACERALMIGAYDRALAEARVAHDLVASSGLGGSPLSVEVCYWLARTLYLTGAHEEALTAVSQASREASTFEERALAYEVLNDIASSRGTGYAEVAATGLRLLSNAGYMHAGGAPADERRADLERIEELLQDRPVSALVDHDSDESTTRAQLALLMDLWEAAYYAGDEELMSFAATRMVRVSLEEGNTLESPFGYVLFAGERVQAGEIPEALEWGDLALALDARAPTTLHTPKVSNIFCNWVLYRGRPFAEMVPLYDRSAALGRSQGDFLFGLWAALFAVWSRLISSFDLRSALARSIELAPFVVRTRDEKIIHVFAALQDTIVTLLGDREEEASILLHDEESALETWRRHAFRPGPTWAAILEAEVLHAEGRYRAALDLLCDPDLDTSERLIMFPIARLLSLRVLCASHLGSLGEDLSACRSFLEVDAARLWEWADGCVENFGVYRALLDGALARDGGDAEAASFQVEEALAHARAVESPYLLAVANDCAAAHWASLEEWEPASRCLSVARARYEELGHGTRLRVLAGAAWFDDELSESGEGERAALATSPPGPTVAQLGQALSSEVRLDRLLRSSASMVCDMTGADRGVLLLTRDAELRVAFDSAMERADWPALGDVDDLPVDLLRSVESLGEPIVIVDALRVRSYARDRYFGTGRTRSVMVLPIEHDQRKVGMLYVENELTPGVFSEAMLPNLRLLLGQLAVSLDNARLYEALLVEVSERREAEAALAESESRLRRAQAFSRMGVWDWDIRTGAIYWSKEAAEILGVLPEDADARIQTFYDLIHDDDRERVQAAIERCFQGEEYGVDHRILRVSDGEVRWLREAGDVLRDAAGEPYRMLGVCQDITDQVEADEARVQLERQLMQAQKMEALGQLTGGIAHDFRNVLSVMSSNAAAMRFHAERMEHVDLCEIAEDMESICSDATQIIRQLLLMARHETIEVAPVDLGTSLRAGLKMLSAALPSSVSVRTSFGEDLPHALCDPVQLNQIVLNLAINARDAMNGEGELLLDLVDAPDVDAACASCHQSFSGPHVELRVADTGPGIPEDIVPRLFEPFYTSRADEGGTGVGLAMVHGILHASGGHVVVDDAPGGGARFRVFFPARARGGVADPKPLARSSIAPTETDEKVVRVLVVDDVPAVSRGVARILQHLGCETVEVSSGAAAVDCVRESSDEFDLVVTDQTMPKMSGVALAGELSQLRPGLPILLHTGRAPAGGGPSLESVGIVKVLHKPVTPDRWRDALEDVVGPRR